MWMAIIAGLVVAGQAAGAGARPQERQRELMEQLASLNVQPVMLAAPLVAADGSQSGPATGIIAEGAQYFVSAPEGSCHAEISTTPPTSPREGWQVTARVTARQLFAATVIVEWQRRWSGGRELTGGAHGRTEVSMRSSDRMPLDRIPTVAPGLPCHGRQRQLELSFFVNASNTPPTLPVSLLPSPLRVELWLIHDKPNQQRGQDIPLHVSQPFDPSGTQAMFRTAVFRSGSDSFTVDVDTHFRVVREESGRIGLWVGLRRIVLDGETGARHMAGASSNTIEWGGPGEVLEFELPAPGMRGGTSGGSGQSGIRGAAAGSGQVRPAVPMLLQGHRFSVRVRFTPAGS